MKHFIAALAFAALAIAMSGATQAQQPPIGQPVARFEYRAFPSVTLTDQEFLIGKKDGVPVTLAAELRFPTGVPANQKLPPIVLLHASGGLGGNDAAIDSWKGDLNRLGIVTVTIDSFTNRGIANTIFDQTQLGRLSMIIDAWQALEFLSKDPRIDVDRVAVMGFSRWAPAAAGLFAFCVLPSYLNIRGQTRCPGPVADCRRISLHDEFRRAINLLQRNRRCIDRTTGTFLTQTSLHDPS